MLGATEISQSPTQVQECYVCIFSLLFFLYSNDTGKENLWNNREPLAFSRYSQGEFFQQSRDQELIELVVFFFLLVTLKFDSGLKVEGEIRC